MRRFLDPPMLPFDLWAKIAVEWATGARFDGWTYHDVNFQMFCDEAYRIEIVKAHSAPTAPDPALKAVCESIREMLRGLTKVLPGRPRWPERN